jgi:hypothetical protein
MEEYDDGFERSEEFAVQSGEWIIKEATQLIKQYKACKTCQAQNRLRPKLDYMLKRLAFEKKEIGKLMGYED